MSCQSRIHPRVIYPRVTWPHCCVTKLFLGDATSIHSPQSDVGSSRQTELQTPSKSSLVNQWVLLRLCTGIWVRGSLEERKWVRDSWITEAHPNMGDRQLTKAGKTGAYGTACRQQTRVERVLSRQLCLSLLQAAWLGWFLLLLGSGLVSESSSQLLFFWESPL